MALPESGGGAAAPWHVRLCTKLTYCRTLYYSTVNALQFFDGDCDAADFALFHGSDTPGHLTLWAPRRLGKV